MDTNQIIGRTKKLRVDLHNSIINHARKLGICNSQEIIEDFKRWYLFDFHNVETSKALSIEGLQNAIFHLDSLSIKIIISGLLLKFNKYSSDKDLLKCTQLQVNKIYAICKGSLKMNNKQMYNYINTSLHRSAFKFNITISEADKVIKRLELYEANISRRGKNARIAS